MRSLQHNVYICYRNIKTNTYLVAASVFIGLNLVSVIHFITHSVGVQKLHNDKVQHPPSISIMLTRLSAFTFSDVEMTVFPVEIANFMRVRLPWSV